MPDNIHIYRAEWDKSDIEGAINCGFTYIELKDEIVGSVYVNNVMMKRIVLELADDIRFDYIPQGIGMIRTAYLKMVPNARDNEIRFSNQDKTMELKLLLV